jgi:hypothetical protein
MAAYNKQVAKNKKTKKTKLWASGP